MQVNLNWTVKIITSVFLWTWLCKNWLGFICHMLALSWEVEDQLQKKKKKIGDKIFEVHVNQVGWFYID